ncbi:conserved hypothetical protein [Beggiatoa sp. PS]|nr:conserved hypothetical protein [Beggiatoa sp. PS]
MFKIKVVPDDAFEDSEQLIKHYVTKARSAIYDNPLSHKPLTTLEVFRQAAQKKPLAAHFWLTRLENISLTKIQAIFAQIPRTEITSIASEFAQKILTLNRQRLLMCWKQLP